MLLALNVHDLRDANFMFVVTALFCVFNRAATKERCQKKGTKKIQIKPVKDASFVDGSCCPSCDRCPQ